MVMRGSLRVRQQARDVVRPIFAVSEVKAPSQLLSPVPIRGIARAAVRFGSWRVIRDPRGRQRCGWRGRNGERQHRICRRRIERAARCRPWPYQLRRGQGCRPTHRSKGFTARLDQRPCRTDKTGRRQSSWPTRRIVENVTRANVNAGVEKLEEFAADSCPTR